ncbi:MAG: hypothetical protein JNK02_00285 [Planctomycetes bacterium]|nr:hypothetical protein [Planctomycetota bacterium]
MITTRSAHVLLALALSAACAAAQTPIGGQPGPGTQEPLPTGPAGGSYGGPGDTLPGSLPGAPGGVPGAPQAPGAVGAPQAPGQPGATPAGPAAGQPPATPTIPFPIGGSDVAVWEAWWALNRDRFLAVRAAVYAPDAAAPREGTGLARRRPDPRYVVDRVIPALVATLDHETDPALLSEALLALARADRGRGADDASSARVHERLVAALGASQLAVAEQAVMALGAHGSTRALPLLAALVADAPEGRAALRRDSVPTRTRALAALALGLAAGGGRLDAQRFAAHALTSEIDTPGRAPLELAAACASALGLLDLESGVVDDGLPPSSSSAALARHLAAIADDSRREQTVRAHAAASAGRVGARAGEVGRGRLILWAAGVARDGARPTPVRQGAAIALGLLGRPEDGDADRLARATLAELARDTDRLVRGLALLARAEIGARARADREKSAALEVQSGLLRELSEARAGHLGFAALALGVLGHESALVAAADANRALEDGWSRARTTSNSAAFGLALGLRSNAAAAPAILARFGREGDPAARASLALGLGLSGAPSALPPLRAASAGENHPVVVRDASIGRALLGDATACEELAALLVTTRSLLVADYAADALSAMGDARALEPLVGLARDRQAPTARRSRAVRALGAAADASLLPWNEPLRAHANFGAPYEAWGLVVQR